MNRKAMLSFGHVSRRNRTNLHFKFVKEIPEWHKMSFTFNQLTKTFYYWNGFGLKFEANGTRSRAIVLAINFKNPEERSETNNILKHFCFSLSPSLSRSFSLCLFGCHIVSHRNKINKTWQKLTRDNHKKYHIFPQVVVVVAPRKNEEI